MTEKAPDLCRCGLPPGAHGKPVDIKALVAEAADEMAKEYDALLMRQVYAEFSK